MQNTKSLKDFRKFEAKIEYESIIDKYAEKCKELVVMRSPVRRGKYKKGWTVEATKKGQTYKAVVRNVTDYQLTHLLENGHLIVNKINGVGYSAPRPHIKVAYYSIKNQFIREINSVDIETKI